MGGLYCPRELKYIGRDAMRRGEGEEELRGSATRRARADDYGAPQDASIMPTVLATLNQSSRTLKLVGLYNMVHIILRQRFFESEFLLCFFQIPRLDRKSGIAAFAALRF
jgi:hypothetical protein